MARSHDYLRRVLERLLDSMRVDAPDVRALWGELEHGLLTHMEAEERFVLPAFLRVDRDESLALLREHGELREHLRELGVAVDLHCTSDAQSHDFADALRHHAEREENLLYRWADKSLDHLYVEKVETHVGGPSRHACAAG